MGFEPILSESGNVFFNPDLHVQDACIAEVRKCQIFLLIIGGRFGSKFKDTSRSVVNEEYKEGVRAKLPIFAVVERQVSQEFQLYENNKGNKALDATKIVYPSVESTSIFDFMKEVQGNSVNNALAPFSDYHELESYLKQQWASMMFNFLSQKAASSQVTDLLETLTKMSDRIEYLAKQILTIVGTEMDRARADINELLSQKHPCIDRLSILSKVVDPSMVVKNMSYRDLLDDLGLEPFDSDDRVNLLLRKQPFTTHIWIEIGLFDMLERDYEEMRANALKVLKRMNILPEAFLSESSNA